MNRFIYVVYLYLNNIFSDTNIREREPVTADTFSSESFAVTMHVNEAVRVINKEVSRSATKIISSSQTQCTNNNTVSASYLDSSNLNNEEDIQKLIQ